MSEDKRADKSGVPAAPVGGVRGFVAGAGYPMRGFWFLLKTPGLWHWAVIPFLLSVSVYAVAIWFGWSYFEGLLEKPFFEGSWWRETLYWILALFSWVLILLIAAFTFVPVAALVANPFNDMLSEKTERLYMNIDVDQPFSIRLLLRSLRVGIIGEVFRFVTVGVLLTFCWFLGLVFPGVGQALGIFITVLFLSLEFTSFSMDRRLLNWPQKKAFLAKYRSRTLGFGAVSFVLLSVPLINAFFIPVSAVAGTMLFCDTELAGPDPPQIPKH